MVVCGNLVRLEIRMAVQVGPGVIGIIDAGISPSRFYVVKASLSVALHRDASIVFEPKGDDFF
jgi:hypothetical protein